MKMRVVICLCALGFGASLGLAGPGVGLVPTSWQLEFEFYDLQRISLKLPGDVHETTFWYMLYKVTNGTGRDVEFLPSFRLVTDTMKVVIGGEEISPSVYDAIAALHKKEYPFFAPPTKVTGLLLQGEENARASAAVFRPFDREASGFTVYVSGLSGDIKRIGNPGLDLSRDASEANPRFFILRRTLAVVYDLPGDPVTQAESTPIRRSREWVMR